MRNLNVDECSISVRVVRSQRDKIKSNTILHDLMISEESPHGASNLDIPKWKISFCPFTIEDIRKIGMELEQIII